MCRQVHIARVAGTGVTYNPELLRTVWEAFCNEEGITAMLHASVVDVMVDRAAIQSVVKIGTELGVLPVDGGWTAR